MSTDPLQLKYPVVLVHGLGARSTYGPFEYFFGLPKLLRNSKNRILIPNLSFWHTIEHRAKQLKLQIETELPEGKINLVGHSMGGLDIRLLASHPDFCERVASVTTIGTPNKGSIMGDLTTDFFPDSAYTAADRILKFVDCSSGGFKQVTRKYCEGKLAEIAPMVPGVAYYSATSAIKASMYKNSLPVFWVPHKVLLKLEGDNDGFVSVESAKWGEHICTYSGDHYAQIGQLLGRSRGLDYMKFYREIFDRLKHDGM